MEDPPSVVLNDVLRLSLTLPSRFSISAADEDPHRSKLIEGILFSRSFIVTYQFVLVGVLLLFTVWHWSEKLVRARRRRSRAANRWLGKTKVDEVDETDNKDIAKVDEAEHRSASSSSSSSTLEGTATPPDDRKRAIAQDENTPLLSTRRERSYGFISRSVALSRSSLMFQPPNIPLFNKTLPSNATTLLVLAFLGLNAFYVFYRVPLSISTMFVFADRTALVFVANLPFLYLLAAKNQPIKLLTGYSYENLNIFHRRIGELLCLLALVHSAGMVVVWYTILRPAGFDFVRFLLEKIILLGLGALVAYELLYFTSLSSFRQRWYELFLGLHVVLQAAALILVWFHHSGSRPYVGAALGIFLLDRLLFRVFVKTRSVRADLTVMEDGDTVMVSAGWPVRPRWMHVFGMDMKYGWKPTEHIFLTVPSLASKHVVQAHPFTIASSAPEGEQQHAWFNLIIRAHDGFSRDLLRYAHSHPSAVVRLDGPYGSLHALEMMQDSDTAVLVVGGSGIAVAYPIIWSLLYAKKLDPEANSGHRQRVCLIWVIHEASHVSWIGQERLDELKEKGLHVVIPSPTMKAGRPDVAALVRDSIDEITNEYDDEGKIGVVVSGPDSMNRIVRNTCASLVRQGRDVSVQIEKYGW